VHNSRRHSIEECRKIKKLIEQFREQVKQQPRQEGAPSHQREGKQKVNPEAKKEEEMEFQNTKRALKAVYGHSKSDSSTDERRKTLHIMYGGSWDIMSWHVIKTLRRAVPAAAPAPRAAPHHKWMETSIGFDASDCPKNMTGAG
jgi:hypothetical protein